jgi:hypothetical protein
MRKFGFSFSWKRALGLSSAKGKISRAIGIPLTKSGRQRKAGRLLGDLAGTALLAGTQIAFKSGSARLPTNLPPRAPKATPRAPSGANASEDLFAAMMERGKSQITDTQAIAAGATLLRSFLRQEGYSSESIAGKVLSQSGGHQCPKCGLVYGAAAKYCGKCGVPLLT